MSNKAFLWIIVAAIVLPIGFLIVNNARNTDSLTANPVGSIAPGHGREAPGFSLQTPKGETITLASYRGEKPVILDFWASWCPNCQRDMPKLSGFYDRYKDEVEVIGINLQESPKTVQRFVEERGISFPIVMDPFGQASRVYGVQYTNTHVLIDKDGNMVRVIPGDIRETDVHSLIETANSET